MGSFLKVFNWRKRPGMFYLMFVQKESSGILQRHMAWTLVTLTVRSISISEIFPNAGASWMLLKTILFLSTVRTAREAGVPPSYWSTVASLKYTIWMGEWPPCTCWMRTTFKPVIWDIACKVIFRNLKAQFLYRVPEYFFEINDRLLLRPIF